MKLKISTRDSQLILSVVIATNVAWAGAPPPSNHGPHAGFVQSDRAVTVELLPGAKKEFFVYPLTSGWDSLPVKAAQLQVAYVSGSGGKSKEQKLECTAQKLEGFKCTLPNKIEMKNKDQILVQIKSDSGEPNLISFVFPFSSEKSKR